MMLSAKNTEHNDDREETSTSVTAVASTKGEENRPSNRRKIVAAYLVTVLAIGSYGWIAAPDLLPLAAILLICGFAGNMVWLALAAAPEAPDEKPTVVGSSGSSGSSETPVPLQLKAAYAILMLMVLVKLAAAAGNMSTGSLIAAVALLIAVGQLATRKSNALRTASFICIGTVFLNVVILFPVAVMLFEKGALPPLLVFVLSVEVAYIFLVVVCFFLLESTAAKEYCCE